MKILFLDFDGVLNSLDNMEANYFLWKSGIQHKSKDRFGDLFDQRCVNWLTYIVMKTNCKIVISSSWRKSGKFAMIEVWEERKMPGYLIGTTPILEDQLRGYEIKEFLLQEEMIGGGNVESYCIVDDDNDMLEGQPLVQTNPIYGLDKTAAIQVMNILNK
jgi:hypothetical protein